MRYTSKGASGPLKFPQTQIVPLLNDNLILFLRSWNGPDANQKVIDEVNHFLSSADADMEVTTPFEYIENLSPKANKVRIAMLLANDVIYKTENKELYSHGFEVALLYKHQREVVWAAVGRFHIAAVKGQQSLPLFDSGRFLDDQVLLPVALVGIGREPDLKCGSVTLKDLQQIEIKSSFGNDSTWWKAIVHDF